MDYGLGRIRRRQSNYGAMSPTKSVQEVQPVALSWHGLTVGKITDDVSGMADAGQLVALTGDGGVGKTTLLNTLLNRNLKSLSVEGKVSINAHSLGRFITYVIKQDDLFMGMLTVKEHLMAQDWMVGDTKRTMRRRVNEVIDEFGLEECRHELVGFSGVEKSILGGETRRLLFASELVNNPQIIFADEPTTGLDFSMAESVISVMRALALSGRTIICTIVQPPLDIYWMAAGNNARLTRDELFSAIACQRRSIVRLDTERARFRRLNGAQFRVVVRLSGGFLPNFAAVMPQQQNVVNVAAVLANANPNGQNYNRLLNLNADLTETIDHLTEEISQLGYMYEQLTEQLEHLTEVPPNANFNLDDVGLQPPLDQQHEVPPNANFNLDDVGLQPPLDQQHEVPPNANFNLDDVGLQPPLDQQHEVPPNPNFNPALLEFDDVGLQPPLDQQHGGALNNNGQQ